MQEPLVSVVLPVYNGERYLAEALRSISAQEYRHFELIVVDDGSTDGSAEIAQSFDGVRYSYQRNQGISSAWNSGVAASKGEFIAFLAQDDLWMPQKLGVQVHHMLSHPHIQYVVAKMTYFLEPGCSMPSGFRKELLGKEHVGFLVETMLARKALFDTIDGFDPSITCGQDVDWFARVKDAAIPMAVIPEVLLRQRIHDDNFTFRTVEEGAQSLLRIVRQSIERQRGSRTSPRVEERR